ncbi:DUF58 domain-containing protein [Haloarchaeobius sp. HRN-SO-5]|uniref:DUF58 domain-containing protein n=1 Tax=Haloarchaeobius sp. HRN-SO-5 TaxID=3446118 RepID=UPI003EBDED83
MLTKRGLGTVAVVVVLVAMAVQFGARQLGAIVLPLFIALLGAVIQMVLTGRPDVERVLPDAGHIGERKRVGLTFDVASPVAASVHDELPPAVDGEGNEFETTIGRTEHDYGVEYRVRGEHELGPLTVTVTDVLGLAERSYTYSMPDTVLVYPRVYTLTGSTRHELNLLPEGAFDTNREEFDRLREYDRSDSLRDVHWKSSAKRPADDLVVKEFLAENDLGDVRIAAEAAEGWDDEMAEAAASIALYLLDNGIAVGLASPNGELDVAAGADQRERLLRQLATVGPGQVPDHYRENADVVITASDEARVSVRLPGHEVPFETFVGDDVPPGGEVAA